MVNMKDYAESFYKSKAWQQVSKLYMSSKNYICERCEGVGVICHHKIYITPQNITDINITLNMDNLECLCQDCHNKEHSLQNNLFSFDESGNITHVNESKQIKQFKQSKHEIDNLLERLKRL